MKNSVLLLGILFLAFTVTAQDASFTVLASKGNALSQSADDPDNYTPLKAGVDINKGDKIIISGNKSYVGLVNKNGNTVELKKSGVYNSDELQKAIEMNEGTLAQKYVDYLVKDMSKDSEKAAHNMSSAGAVDRSTDDTALKLFLPESVAAVDGRSAVKWLDNDKHNTYKVVLQNMFDEEVMSTEVKDNIAYLDFSNDNISHGDVLKLTVYAADDNSVKSQTAKVQFADKEKSKNVQSEIAALSSKGDEATAADHVVLASYYKKNGYLMNALNHYLMAKDLQPDVEAYDELYNKLLYRMGM